MVKQILYTYLGDNGTLQTPIHLEGIYSVINYLITAEDGYLLTKDNKNFTKSIIVTKEDLDKWQEIDEETVNNK